MYASQRTQQGSQTIDSISLDNDYITEIWSTVPQVLSLKKHW